MRHPRLTPLAVLCSALIAVAVLPAASAQAAEVHYVALGDSYSSGDAAGSHSPSSGDCLRSASASPVKGAAAPSPASFAFVACAGATTADVVSGQLGAVTSGTTLISITIGGNDVGFS